MSVKYYFKNEISLDEAKQLMSRINHMKEFTISIGRGILEKYSQKKNN